MRQITDIDTFDLKKFYVADMEFSGSYMLFRYAKENEQHFVTGYKYFWSNLYYDVWDKARKSPEKTIMKMIETEGVQVYEFDSVVEATKYMLEGEE